MALFMVCGEPAKAFAAEFIDDQGEFTQEIETLEEEQFEDADSFAEDEIITEDAEIREDEIPQEILEQLLEEDADEAVEETVSDSEFVEIPNEDEADRALRLLNFNEGKGLENLKTTDIPSSAYTIKRYADHVNIVNTASGTNLADFLYVALVYKDPAKQGKFFVLGEEVAPGKSVDLSFVYLDSRKKELVNEKEDYVLWMGRGDSYVDENDVTQYYNFKLLGYIPDYDDEGNIIEIDGERQYEKVDMVEIDVPAEASYPDLDSDWKDGYTGINMKAAIQKNFKSVKISWKPDTKAHPEQKEFKKYELYRLSSPETGFKETLISAASSGKSATDKNVDIFKDSLIYLLKCYDASGKLVAQFVTIAAPYMLEMQSGITTGTFDFKMTSRPDDTQLYLLQLAGVNKEASDKVTNGFQTKWTTVYQVDDGFNQGYGVGEYFISKNSKPQAIELSYNIEQPEITIGAKYFGRLQTLTYLKGLKVISAPSNVLNCKAGPEKMYVLTSAGVYYDDADAKKSNRYNIARANEHINAYFNGEEISSKSPIYIHDTNTEVCAKSGLIYFIASKELTNIKAFDLLKCDASSGKFKKVKTFSIKSPAVMECTITSELFSSIKVYALHYNNFVPEKDIYYSVRAISNVKNTAGGYGAGELIKPEMDVVQNFSTTDVGSDRIGLYWTVDDCVKQYWVYRSETSLNGAERTKAGQNGDTVVAKINGSKAKKYTTQIDDEDENNTKVIRVMSFEDKKNVKVNASYYYYIRPVYNVKAAEKDNELYIDKASIEVKGKASAMYARVGSFKAGNEALSEIRVSFNQVKGVNTYRLFKLEVDKSVSKLTSAMKPDLDALYTEAFAKDYPTYEEFEEYISTQPESRWLEIIQSAGYGGNNWEYVATVSTNGSSTASKSYVDKIHVAPGSYYFYLVQPASYTPDGHTNGVCFSYTGRVQNVPLPVTKANATYRDNAIRLSWELNSKDASKAHLSVQVSTDGGSHWINANKNGYTDSNPGRGVDRTYQIRVRYHDGSVNVYSSTVTVKYSLPAGIEVTKASDVGEFVNDTYTVKKGQEGCKLSYRAYLSNGATAAYNKIDFSKSDGNCVKITDNSSNSVTFNAENTGTMTFYLSCAGITRRITVVVVEK